MPRKLFRKYLPSHQSIRENRYLRFFGAALQHHNLWHLQSWRKRRRSRLPSMQK
jgi:hypothetical protein